MSCYRISPAQTLMGLIKKDRTRTHISIRVGPRSVTRPLGLFRLCVPYGVQPSNLLLKRVSRLLVSVFQAVYLCQCAMKLQDAWGGVELDAGGREGGGEEGEGFGVEVVDLGLVTEGKGLAMGGSSEVIGSW